MSGDLALIIGRSHSGSFEIGNIVKNLLISNRFLIQYLHDENSAHNNNESMYGGKCHVLVL